jgi:hypothetical protein
LWLSPTVPDHMAGKWASSTLLLLCRSLTAQSSSSSLSNFVCFCAWGNETLLQWFIYFILPQTVCVLHSCFLRLFYICIAHGSKILGTKLTFCNEIGFHCSQISYQAQLITALILCCTAYGRVAEVWHSI